MVFSWQRTLGFWLVALCFFFGSLLLVIAGRGSLFVSPDETANAFFIRQFSETGTLRVADTLTAQFQNQLYPRSVVAVNGQLVPQSFLGLPVLYGMVSYFFGPWMVWILTPLLTIIAAVVLRRTLETWFSPSTAFLSSVLFLLHPAVWYYSARGLMHNLLFVDLLVFAVWFVVCSPIATHLAMCVKRIGRLQSFQQHIDQLLAGVLIGLALFVRTSEVYWVLGLVLVWGVWHWRSNKSRSIRVFAGIVLGFIPFFVFNTLTYGQPLMTGYTVSSITANSASLIPALPDPQTVLFPFGIHLRQIAKHVLFYGVSVFWWLSILAIIGFGRLAGRMKWYAWVFVCVAVWLGVWYGSWTIADNPDPTQISLANSYVRYWIPVFLLSVPFVAEGMNWVSTRARSQTAKRFALSALLIAVIALNIRVVFLSGQDPLIRVVQTLETSHAIKASVLALTESESVIVVDRADKLFFPDRHVRYPLRSEETYALLPKLAARGPLYYFGITFPEQDLRYLNEKKLAELGLAIKPIETYALESLYQLILLTP